MITTNMPAIAGTKYMSATDCGAGVAGVGVGAAGSTAKLVSEDDGQYDSDPAKVAMTVYLPGMSGVHWKLNVPLGRSWLCRCYGNCHSQSITSIDTGTPVAFVGIGFCM